MLEKKKNENFTFYDPQVNLYVQDVETSIKFYSTYFGFKESFRTPKTGKPDHVELLLGRLNLGIASIESAKRMHGIDVGGDHPKGEVVLWTDNVDAVYEYLLENNVQGISRPHTFLDTIRSAWIADPDNNLLQLVSKVH